MRPGLGWLASLLVFPLAGAPLLAHPAFRRWGIAARFGVAAGVGAFAVTTTMTLWTLARGTWSLPLVAAAGLVECLALRFAIPRRAADGAGEIEVGPRTAGDGVAIVVLALSVVAASAATLAAAATSTDLLLFWGPKGAAFASARAVDADYLADHLHRYQHASYPPLVPQAFAFATLASGTFSWLGAAATFPVLLALLGAALPGLLRRFAPRRDALAATALVAAALALSGVAFQIAGNADPFLLFFEVLAVAVLLGAPARDGAAQVAAGLLLGGAAASKVEGLPFVLCAAVFYLLLRRGRGRDVVPWGRLLAAAARLLAPTAVALGGWFAFGRQRAVFLGYESYGPALEIHWETLGRVLVSIGKALGDAALGLPWVVPIAACAVSRGSRERVYLVTIAAVLSLFFVFTYLHGPDPTAWISWSAGRIFLIVSPLLAVAAITPPGGAPGAEATTALPPRERSRG